ncbi:MAG TPA: serine/threonine-protein kinase, partial [Polyangiaceae bacterium]
MGEIFEAQHLRLYRRVAVKMLPPSLAERPELRARFEQEAELVSQIQHRNVVDVLDYDVTEGGEPYLVLEMLHGETLAALLTKTCPLPLGTAITIMSQIALGLSAAHRAAVVHRDLKPDNVFLTADPDEPLCVKLLDFGISKNLRSSRRITKATMILGTPDYMAPEQASGDAHDVDARTDQHALAVVTYEMLTGVQPFAHDDMAMALRNVISLEPPPASSLAGWLPREVDAVLGRALSKIPKRRYPDVIDFARALTAGAGVPMSLSSRPPPAAPTARFSSPPMALGPGPTGAEFASPEITRARSALAADDIEGAARHAEAACIQFDAVGDDGRHALFAVEPLLTRIFASRLGSLDRVIRRVRLETAGSMSPRTAFLLSRLDAGTTIGDALDVAAMPRLEGLRRLVQLEALGVIEIG